MNTRNNDTLLEKLGQQAIKQIIEKNKTAKTKEWSIKFSTESKNISIVVKPHQDNFIDFISIEKEGNSKTEERVEGTLRVHVTALERNLEEIKNKEEVTRKKLKRALF